MLLIVSLLKKKQHTKSLDCIASVWYLLWIKTFYISDLGMWPSFLVLNIYLSIYLVDHNTWALDFPHLFSLSGEPNQTIQVILVMYSLTTTIQKGAIKPCFIPHQVYEKYM